MGSASELEYHLLLARDLSLSQQGRSRKISQRNTRGETNAIQLDKQAKIKQSSRLKEKRFDTRD